MRTFKFAGAGDGVPGLPHEVTDEQAAELGLTTLLRQAVEAGTFAEVKPARKHPEKAGEED